MNIEQRRDGLRLRIGDGAAVSFRVEWVGRLRAIPYDKYGDFIRDAVYPALSPPERELWNISKINNRDLQIAVWEFS